MKTIMRFLVAFALVAGAFISTASTLAQTTTGPPGLEPGQSLGLALGIGAEGQRALRERFLAAE